MIGMEAYDGFWGDVLTEVRFPWEWSKEKAFVADEKAMFLSVNK